RPFRARSAPVQPITAARGAASPVQDEPPQVEPARVRSAPTPACHARGVTDEEDRAATAVAVAAGGTFVLRLGWAVHSRAVRLAGLAATLAGAGLYVRGRLEVRHQKIEAAESSVAEALDDLDPIARAQVLKDAARGLIDG